MKLRDRLKNVVDKFKRTELLESESLRRSRKVAQAAKRTGEEIRKTRRY